jgi:hypothetical protein
VGAARQDMRRQAAYLHPSFILARTLGPIRFQACVEATIRLVEPRYTPQVDPRELADAERVLSRAGAQLVALVRAPVAELVKAKKPVAFGSFLEGMEHTAIRAAHLLSGDLEVAAAVLRQPEAAVLPLPYGVKMKELIAFVVSEQHFDLRERIGLAIAGG